jgi:hypothetical protein
MRDSFKSKKTNALIVTHTELLRAIKRLAVKATIADKFEKDLIKLDMSDIDRRWYRHQKEHWIGWLSEYATEGYYGRKNETKRSAGLVYGRIKNPAMLLWLVDASGVSRTVVRKARLAALKASDSYNTQCGAIRRVVPWELVEDALLGGKKGSK